MTRKLFAVPDLSLWEDLRKTIKPLKASTAAKFNASVSYASATTAFRPQPLQAPKPVQHRSEPPPLSAFDRRTAQKLSRGQLEPESRIDLHGESVETARMRLYHYLQSQHQQGLRFVLVITGKGASPYARHTLHSKDLYHAPEREGRLRREVPLWLHEANFRAHVVGYQPAHPRHGGGGAFYVKLRRHGAA
jgi:DNA-nicking Smr family endonuclease